MKQGELLNMTNVSFYSKIMNLINNKTEGQYWDFKREPHKNNESLLHDILCLANAKHNGDRFLIIGVDDPKEDCEIIGLDETTEKRKNEADLNDFLNSKEWWKYSYCECKDIKYPCKRN